MKPTPLILLTAALVMALPVAQAAKPKKPTNGPKKIYCWEDNGRKICGDALPADAVNNARTEINGRTGLTTRRVERTLTPQEIEANEAAARLAAAQQAAAEAEQQHQQQLVLSYADEAALNRAYEGKEAAVKAEMAKVQGAIDDIRKVLVAKLGMAVERGFSKKSAGTKSDQSIRELHEQIMDQEAVQARHRQELQLIAAERAESLSTFKGVLEQAQVSAQAQAPGGDPATDE